MVGSDIELLSLSELFKATFWRLFSHNQELFLGYYFQFRGFPTPQGDNSKWEALKLKPTLSHVRYIVFTYRVHKHKNILYLKNRFKIAGWAKGLMWTYYNLKLNSIKWLKTKQLNLSIPLSTLVADSAYIGVPFYYTAITLGLLAVK